MNLLALLSLFASSLSLGLGILVYFVDRKSTLNKMFLLTLTASFLYSFTTVMMWTAPNAANATFWNEMGAEWPFFTVLVLNFVLVFTNSTWLKNKWIYPALYAPATIFFLTEVFTDLINGPPVMEYWGYNDVASGTWVYLLSTIWTVTIPILAFIICLRYYRKGNDPIRRQQSKYVTAGLGIPIAAFIGTNIFARSFDIDIPNVGFISTLFFSAFVGYAIVKHELFTFDAAIAAENILFTMPDSLLLTDMNGHILRVNEQWVNLIGYKKHELIGQPLSSFCAEGEEKKCSSFYDELTNLKVIKNTELTIITRDGELKYSLFSGSAVKSKTGKYIGMVFVINDITSRKVLEERLMKAEKLATVGDLARQLGHDIRNPLAAIKFGLYYLGKEKDKLSKSARDILQTLDNTVEDADRIVTSLVDYSTELVLESQYCTPKSLTQYALSNNRIPDRITVIDNTTEDQLFLDAEKMQSAFASLVKNSIEAISGEGTIQISSSVKNSMMEISFADSGGGMPKEILPKIFSPLVTTKAKGMGMGLAICKRIIDAHGGQISVESTVGKGTKITILLPLELPKNKTKQVLQFEPSVDVLNLNKLLDVN